MENLNDVIEFYKEENTNKHKIIYDCFTEHVNKIPILLNQHNLTPGFGEIAFSWNWYLLVKDMPENFKFLEIGVFKGRVIALIKLLSDTFTNPDIIKKTQELIYDIIFIDGCHDYEVVCTDIKNYSEMIKLNGYLVLDDASSLLPNSHGIFLGHYDVGKAIIDVLEKDSRFVHLYAVGHNRVWKKIK